MSVLSFHDRCLFSHNRIKQKLEVIALIYRFIDLLSHINEGLNEVFVVPLQLACDLLSLLTHILTCLFKDDGLKVLQLLLIFLLNFRQLLTDCLSFYCILVLAFYV